jgi:Ca-activated chloride channel family protein
MGIYRRRQYSGLLGIGIGAVITSGVLVCPYPALSDVGRRVNRANRLYEQGKIDDAIEIYQDAQLREPDSNPLHYNIGNAFNRRGDYGQAMAEYQKVLASQDTALSQPTLYNLGEALLRSGQIEQSIQAYMGALALDPEDVEAKHNLEFALQMLQQQQQQQGQQQQDQQQQQQQQDQQQQQQQQQQDQQEESQQQEQDQQKGQQDQSQQEEQQPQLQTGPMSKEEADRILNAIREQEERNQQQDRKAQAVRARGDKDW